TPLARYVSVYPKQFGDFFNRAIAMDFDEPIIWAAFSYGKDRNAVDIGQGATRTNSHALTHTLTLRLASIRRCNHCWTSASNQPTALPPRLTGLGKVPCVKLGMRSGLMR